MLIEDFNIFIKLEIGKLRAYFLSANSLKGKYSLINVSFHVKLEKKFVE